MDKCLIDNVVWVSYQFLKNWVSKKTIEDWQQRKVGDRISIEGRVFIKFSSIPKPTRNKLPSEVELLTDIKMDAYNGRIERIVKSLEHHKNNSFHKHYNYVSSKYDISKERCREVAQKWACWVWIKDNYSKSPHDLQYLVAAYNKVFNTTYSEISFCTLRTKSLAEIEKGLVIDKRHIRKTVARISDFQLNFLQYIYIQPQKISANQAHPKLVEACKAIGEKPYSLQSVKLYFKQFKNNAQLFEAREGAAAAQKQLSFASLLPALHRNTQWQIDGWTMPFWGDKFQRYVLYLIRDNHSRRIIGHSVATSENTTLILDALDDAMRNTGCFPGELVSDKHSFHKTEVAARLRIETEKMGAIWTVTINAQRNQLAERYNQYLDTICKDFADYLGKNMTAKGDNAHPNPEAMATAAKPANWKTVDEIMGIATYIIKEFNRTPLNVLDGLSPNQKYDASESLKAFTISEAERVRLLRPVSAYKVTRGQITIKIGMRKHEFQLPAKLIDRYNNQKLEVAYEDLEQGIYITDLTTGEELGCITPKRKIHGAIPDQTEADVKMLNQQTGRRNGTISKARKTVEQRIKDGLADNPEAMDLINSFTVTKDIRQLAQQDAELKKQMAERGEKVDMMPIRKPAPAVLSEIPNGTGRTRERPFAAEKTDMRFISYDELLNELDNEQ